MTLQERLEQDLIVAIKSGQEKRRDVLRNIKSNLKNYKIDQKGGEELTDEDTLMLLGREIKRRKESIEAYQVAKRPELAADEQAEIDIIQPYMPEQMSEDDIRQIVAEYFKTNTKDPSQTGKSIGALSQQLKGKADMAVVAKIVREVIQ